MPSNHLTLCCPLLLLPSIFPSIKAFSNESASQTKMCVKEVDFTSIDLNCFQFLRKWNTFTLAKLTIGKNQI